MNATHKAAPTPSVVADLRALLLLRFPASHAFHAVADAPPLLPKVLPTAMGPFTTSLGHGLGHGLGRGVEPLPTGVEPWDALTGGLRLGEVTELCGTLGGTGLVMDRLLEVSAAAGWLGAWVDAGDSLEVGDWAARALRRILWVRCRTPLMALKGADLLLRDGNLSWVALDLQAVSEAALRRISAQHWHRFHRLVEHRGNALLVLTPSPMVEGAKVRVLSRRVWTLASLNLPRSDLLEEASPQVFLRGRQPDGMHPPRIPPSHPPTKNRLVGGAVSFVGQRCLNFIRSCSVVPSSPNSIR